MSESYSVKAILSATDRNFLSTMDKATLAIDKATRATDGLATRLKNGFSFGAAMEAGRQAFSVVTGAVSDLIGEVNSSNASWKTFTKNMQIVGKDTKYIKTAKEELQDFAQKTIYSSSDMATTFSQLEAVGVKNTTALVKGFGGLAAAAEDPQQAMKSLSQQATQMAAKPTVAWEDFKIMLEQSPAGIAAVARAMKMSTSEMVSAVQGKKIKTADFFAAIQKAGTSKEFTKLATEAKTMGQAMDGLQETMGNKMLPVWDTFSQVGINAINAVADKIGEINVDKLTKQLEPIADRINAIIDAFSANGISGALSEITAQLGQSSGVVKQFGAAIAAAFVITNLSGFISTTQSAIQVLGNLKIPSLDFSKFTKNALKSTRGIKKSFAAVGASVDAFGGSIAASMEAISPRLSESGLKIWDTFANTGDKISSLGKGISKKMTSQVKTITGGFSAIGSAIGNKVGTILGPFQMLASGITSIGGQIAARLTSIMGLAMNALMPAALVGVVLAGFGLLYQQFGGEIDQMLAMAQQKGPQIITNLAQGISSALPGLIASGAQLMNNLMATITANLPAVISGGTQIVANLVSGVAAAAPSLMTSAISMIAQFVVSVAGQLPTLINSGMQMLLALSQGVASNLPQIIQMAVQAIAAFAVGLGQNLPQIMASAVQIVVTLAGGIVRAIPELIKAVPQMVMSLINAIMSTDWLQVGKDIVGAIGKGLSDVKDWFTGGEKGGKETTSGVASGVASNASQVTSAAQGVTNSLVTTLQSGEGAAQQAGQALMAGYSSAVESGSTQAVTTVTDSTGKIVESLQNTTPQAQKNGQETGKAYTDALKSDLDKAPAIADQAVKSVIAKLQSGVSGAKSAGQMISSGFAEGMRANLGAIESAAARMVAAADKAVRAEAQIHSPSRRFKKTGQYIPEGLGAGIAKNAYKAVAASKSLAKQVLSAFKQANNTGNYEKLGSSLAKKYSSAMKSQKKNLTATVKNLINAKTISKSYKTVGKKLYEQFKKQFEAQADKAITVVDNRLTALGNKFQEKYDAIVDAREAFRDNLRRVDLYSKNNNGKIVFTNYAAETKKVRQLQVYLGTLQHLKTPQGILDEIVSMDTADALEYSLALLKMSRPQFQKYIQSYNKFQKATASVSDTFYKQDLEKLKKTFNSTVTKEMKTLHAKLNQIGVNAMKGLITGMNSQKKNLDTAGKVLANRIIKSFKKELKIHSPSRVFYVLARYIGAGVVKGLDSMVHSVQTATMDLITIPTVSVPNMALSYGGELSAEYDYYRNYSYTIEVPVTVDGREIAKATAGYTQEELDRRQARSDRKHGKR